jgi:hypothetical protein
MDDHSQGPYQPLQNEGDTEDRFRLLSLAPGSYDDPIQITLTTHDIQLAPNATKRALRSIKSHLEIIGRELERTGYVQADGSRAELRFLRNLDESFKLWESLESFRTRQEALEFVKEALGELVLLDWNRFVLNQSIVDAICGLVEHLKRFIDSQIDFDALSYTWGTTKAADTVIVNDWPLEITQNLNLALRHLRHPEQARVMWIDALCINQQDIDERNYQVPLMGSIYAGATQITVWLGPAADESDLVMEVIRSSDMQDVNPFCLSIDILRLMSRSWWTRVWVIQEVALAQRAVIHCGMQSIPHDDFLVGLERACTWCGITKLKNQSEVDDAARKLSHSEDLLEFLPRALSGPVFTHIQNGMPVVEWMYYSLGECWCLQSKHQSLMLNKDRSGMPFSKLWRMSRHFLATDPRDKVYALLSMVSLSGQPIYPDYRKSVVSVLSEAFALTILEDLSIAYSTCPLRKEHVSIPDLPSWGPDLVSLFSLDAWLEDGLWSDQDPRACCPGADLIKAAYSSLTRAPGSRMHSPQTAFSADFKELYTVGTKIGIVIKSTTFPSPPIDRADLESGNIKKFTAIRQLLHGHPSSLHKLPSVLRGIPGELYEPEEDDLAIIEGIEGTFDPARSDLSAASQDYIRTFRAWLQFLDERTLLMTDTGHMGRSQGDIKEGDVLAGLFGINLPFVLRPKDGGKYAMINTAHVADHLLSPPWRDRDQRFRKRKRQRTRREEKFTII